MITMTTYFSIRRSSVVMDTVPCVSACCEAVAPLSNMEAVRHSAATTNGSEGGGFTGHNVILRLGLLPSLSMCI